MMAATGRRRARRENERGATVVEFAVIASLFLVIIFGILEFALIFMQGHLVENGAREGVRVGVRANNYTNFDGVPPGTDCTLPRCDRKFATEQKVRDYLDIFYSASDITVLDVQRRPRVDDDPPVLSVKVTVKNFLPPLVSALVPGYTTPETFEYTATGFYEDPDEYAKENL